MSITAVPISIVRVRAPTAARSGNGEPSWRAKWCTRKYAPSRPSASAATASSIDCRRASEAVRTSEYGDGVQWPKERKPIVFTQRTLGGKPDPSVRKEKMCPVLINEHDRSDGRHI